MLVKSEVCGARMYNPKYNNELRRKHNGRRPCKPPQIASHTFREQRTDVCLNSHITTGSSDETGARTLSTGEDVMIHEYEYLTSQWCNIIKGYNDRQLVKSVHDHVRLIKRDIRRTTYQARRNVSDSRDSLQDILREVRNREIVYLVGDPLYNDAVSFVNGG